MINIKEQKAKLDAQKAELREELDALGMQNSDGDWIVRPDEGDGTMADPIDNADITEDFEEKVARLNVLETQYTQVLKALIAIETGTYGTCEVSGEKISDERLKAYPAATTCINHAN
ncbi:TraR/DksA C4-type zinc finger protein [Patescibacteria group bacterium]|nr:TraR/DksA C4-type zinc finger protein [Patescibacteria group bacterium]